MNLVYALKLSLVLQKTDINTMKIDDSALTTYEMVIAGFLLQNKLDRALFFEKILLLVNTSIEVVFGMSFFSLSDTHINRRSG